MHDRAVPRLRLLRGRRGLTTSVVPDYEAAVAALRSRGRFGVSLGLARIEALLDELGNPQRRLRGALVGGTNGKGSVVALARSALQEAGLRIGTMPKPHLVSYRERIAIDGRPISRERFAAALGAVTPAIERVEARLGPPTDPNSRYQAGHRTPRNPDTEATELTRPTPNHRTETGRSLKHRSGRRLDAEWTLTGTK